MIFGPIYYISRSQYYHVAYKLTDSDILGDNLKVYPRFSYGRQDPRTFMAFMRIAAFILVIVALAINPFYLFGAGFVLMLSFMKPWPMMVNRYCINLIIGMIIEQKIDVIYIK